MSLTVPPDLYLDHRRPAWRAYERLGFVRYVAGEREVGTPRPRASQVVVDGRAAEVIVALARAST